MEKSEHPKDESHNQSIRDSTQSSNYKSNGGNTNQAVTAKRKVFAKPKDEQNETLRKTLQWYIRFDLYASVLAGCGTILGREWAAAAHDYYARQALEKPNEIEYKFEERIFRSRLLATDIAILFAKRTRGAIEDDDFVTECDALSNQFDMYEIDIDLALRDPSKLVTAVGHND